MRDPYRVLGVPRDIDDDGLKRRWRELAREHHPDRGGDATVFAELSAAWAVLSDPAWRARFDAHGLDATSAFFDPSLVQPPPERSAPVRPAPRPVQPGEDLEVALELDGAQARSGGVHEVTVAPARTCETCGGTGWRRAGRACGKCEGGVIPGIGPFRVQVPPDVVDGQELRVPGFGRAGRGKGALPGDLRIVVQVAPEFWAASDGTRVLLRVPAGVLREGGAVRVPLPNGGAVRMTVPPGTRLGQVFRLRGKGIGGGDLQAEVARGPREPQIVSAVRIALS